MKKVQVWARLVCKAVVAELPRIALLLTISFVLSLIANAVHPMGLPLVVRKGLPGIPNWITNRFQGVDVTTGYRLAKLPGAILVDTRDEEDFLEERARQAISLPYHGFEQHYAVFAERVPKHAHVLLYCYGTSCGLAARVAKRLVVRGYQQVTVLRNGFQAWKAKGLPVESGGKVQPSQIEE